MKISIIIPAYNEEKYLAPTLETIVTALNRVNIAKELIVVDNESTDSTADIAKRFGASVVKESIRNIGRVRNAGAETASGDVLVFIDADTSVPITLFERIAEIMSENDCFGGAVSVDYGPFERRWMRYYPALWKFWGSVFNMKQGAAQFCRRNIFFELGGYDESIFLGEDVAFYWSLSKLASQKGGHLDFIEDLSVLTSSRRFDKMSLWRTAVLTHPIFIGLFYKRASVWKDWYDNAVR